MYILSFIDDFNKLLDQFKAWIIANHSNPFLWIGLFGLGLLTFHYLYNTLQK